MLLMWYLAEAPAYPFEHERPSARFVVASSLYNGLAVAGVPLLLRRWDRAGPFTERMAALVAVMAVCVAMRGPVWGEWPSGGEMVAEVTFEVSRAVAVAFAIAHVAHCVYARYLPTTLLRIRDIRPVLWERRGGAPARVRHCRSSMYLFGLSTRRYLDTTALRLGRHPAGRPGVWREWAEVTGWSLTLLFSFAIYIELYPRVAEAFRSVLTSVMAAQLLALIPLMLLPAYPVDRLGARIPVGEGEFEVARGFRLVSYRWTTVSFLPIIVIAVLIRIVRWGNLPDLMDVMLLTGPTVAMVNLVYLDRFRDLTVEEVLHAIPERERAERGMWGADPWTEASLTGPAPTVEGPGPGPP